MIVTIERAKLYPTAGRAYRTDWKWTYTYRVDSGPVAQYGSGLSSLRSMLKCHFPGARLVETWRV